MTRVASLVLVVRSLERAIAIYEQGFGFSRVDEVSDVPSLGARHVVLRGENCLLELVEPHDDTKPPGLFLRARGEGMFAMELRVDEPDEVRKQLSLAFVEVRGTAEDPGHWYVRPADAHGMLIEVAPAERA
jgi:catechol 2,3-dioxygenase-like lactoylglutathione lyase family enzyme